MLDFLNEACVYGRAIADGTAHPAQRQVFCIRLYGVLHDLWRRYKEPLSIERPERADDARAIQLRRQVSEELTALRSQISDEEKVYLELKRNELSHPYLSSNNPNIDDSSDNWDAFRVNLLDKRQVKIERALAIIRDLDTRLGAVALQDDMVRRCLPGLERLHTAFVELFALSQARRGL